MIKKIKKWWYYNDDTVYSTLLLIAGAIGIGILIDITLLVLLNVAWPFAVWSVNNPNLTYTEKLATIALIIFTLKDFSGKKSS